MACLRLREHVPIATRIPMAPHPKVELRQNTSGLSELS